MRARQAVVVAGVTLLFAAIPLLAHHGLDSQYDPARPIMLKGTVTKIAWSSPHVRFNIEAQDQGAAGKNWELEMDSPNMLLLKGWKIDTLKPGDHVAVSGYHARDDSNRGYASKVTITAK
jgi:hypothetical protein